jgi:hypothetical protein
MLKKPKINHILNQRIFIFIKKYKFDGPFKDTNIANIDELSVPFDFYSEYTLNIKREKSIDIIKTS